ncbi:MAG: hypothetical protein WC369_05655 [Dehalococcoidales bacterium]|jgi:hypothetical protein
MKKLFIKSALGVIIIFTAITAPAYCAAMDNVVREDAGDYSETKSTEGTVTSIDGDGGVFTVIPFDAATTNDNELTIQVMPDTQVYKAGGKIRSSDIQINDIVAVDYLDDRAGLKAVTVNVQ